MESSGRHDRYMLVTTASGLEAVRAGWKESLPVFMDEIKALRAEGLSLLAASVKTAFDLLNVNRLATGIDNYGAGRNPWYTEPAMIVVFTDGGPLTSSSGVQETLVLPLKPSLAGGELTSEPYRWDQKVFSVALKLTRTDRESRRASESNNGGGNAGGASDATAAIASNLEVGESSHILRDLCYATGGKAYSVWSRRSLNHCVEMLAKTSFQGVMLSLEQLSRGGSLVGPDFQNITSHHVCISSPESRLPKATFHWPIPEAFWMKPGGDGTAVVPPRASHPVVRFVPVSVEPRINEQFPFDKYDLDSCPLSRYILDAGESVTAWQVFVPDSSPSGSDAPFGFLKARSKRTSVVLTVMPYNYPVLLSLVDTLMNQLNFLPSTVWKQEFKNYLLSVPAYYIAPLRVAFSRICKRDVVDVLFKSIPDSMMSFPFVQYLAKLKKVSVQEAEKIISVVARRRQPLAVSQAHVQAQLEQQRERDATIRGRRNVNSGDGSNNSITSSGLTRNGTGLGGASDFRQVLHARSKVNGMGAHSSVVVNNSINKVDPPPVSSGPNASPSSDSSVGGGGSSSGALLTGSMLARERAHAIWTRQFINPFDVPRDRLLTQLSHMREHLLEDAVAGRPIREDLTAMHSLPIAQMGNYQEALLAAAPLRTLAEEDEGVRPLFGNPFKLAKRLAVDEADEAAVQQGPARKRHALHHPGSPRPAPGSPRSDSPQSPRSAPGTPRSDSASPLRLSPGTPRPDTPPQHQHQMSALTQELNKQTKRDKSSKRDVIGQVTSPVSHPSPASAGVSANGIPSDIRTEMLRELKKPGKNHTALFELLKSYNGPPATRKSLVATAITEARRYKKNSLADRLEAFKF